jgi:glycosyltransferase involved in cell wall biosynthesis
MSVYNAEEYLERAVRSVMEQTFPHWELVVVDDCSTDSSLAILERLAEEDDRIRIHRNKKNSKLPTSLNTAISLAQGEYVARMDADDICLPHRLETQLKFMEENPRVDFASCRYMSLKNGEIRCGGCGGKGDGESVAALLLFTNPILHPGLIAKRSVMLEEPYDTTLTCTEDLELWCRLAAKGKVGAIQGEYLMLYRLHAKQITATTKARQMDEVAKIEERYFSSVLCPLTKEELDFYVRGVYFRDEKDVWKLKGLFRRLKKENKKKKAFSPAALSWAMFEILAEYKRSGLGKMDLIWGFTAFSPLFLLKELRERKKRAFTDGEKCIRSAATMGLLPLDGNPQCPSFTGKVE